MRTGTAMAEGAGLLAGKPIPEIEVEIRDHEVFVAGEHVNQGYLDPADDASTKSQRDGKLWHRTGDAARTGRAGAAVAAGAARGGVRRALPVRSRDGGAELAGRAAGGAAGGRG